MASLLIKKLIGEADQGEVDAYYNQRVQDLFTTFVDAMKQQKSFASDPAGIDLAWKYFEPRLRKYMQDPSTKVNKQIGQMRMGTYKPLSQVGEADTTAAHRPGTEPAYDSGIPSGDSHNQAVPVKKKAEELPHDDEETRELKIADAILRAAQGMAKSPAVDEIINQANELKRIHGVQ